jgi:UDP-arabinose 4-epimerase
MTQAVLVAGGAGYIGSHVSKALAAAGYQPIVLDNFSTGRRDFVRFGPVVEACVSDVAAVKRAVAEYGITAAIDLAGSIEVAESVADPLKYYDNNVAKKIPFLRALTESGVKAFVFSSTAAVYGEPTEIPIPESHATNPTSPYGWSKLMFERLLHSTGAATSLRFMALRYFNAAGASLDGEIGESHDPETHLIPRACLASLGHIPPLEIFGNDYPTPDGTALRDYIHVMDLAQAHVLAVTKLLSGAPSAAFNLGNGVGTSIGDIITTFDRLGYAVPHSFKGRRAGDPSRLVANSSAARAALDWAPRYADIETIIRSAYQWHEKNPPRVKAN